jgi:hypothetical protein
VFARAFLTAPPRPVTLLFGGEVFFMFRWIAVRSAVLCLASGFLTACTSPAGAGSKDAALSPEGAKEALLQMMRSKAGQDLGWFKGDVPDEMAKMRVEEEKDGWFAWTGAFRFNPFKGVYTLVVRPKPGVRASVFEYEGSFVRKDGTWSATPPRLVRSALQPGD